MIDLNKVGYAISISRREKGYTQDELASRLGVTPQAVSKWERGLSLPDTDMLPDISKILEISVDDLLAGEIPVKAAVRISESQAGSPVNIVDSLLPDEILIEISLSLCQGEHVFPDELIKNVIIMRRELAREYGIILPVVRIRDNEELENGVYRINFRGKCYACEKVNNEPEAEAAKAALYRLRELVLSNPEAVITRQMVKVIVENLSEKHHVLVTEVIPERISYGRLKDILTGLIKEGKPINDMVTILETIDKLIDENIGTEGIVKRLLAIL